MHDLPLLINIGVALTAALIGGDIARRIGLPPIVGYLMAGVAIVVMAIMLVHNITIHPQLSWMDEVGNGDYLYQASHGGMAQLGERLGPERRRSIGVLLRL